MSNLVKDISDADFQQEVYQSELPVLVDFYGANCSNCRLVASLLDELFADYSAKAKFVKINIDNHKEYASEFAVMSLPTLIMIKAGQAVATLTGRQALDELEDVLDEHLG